MKYKLDTTRSKLSPEQQIDNLGERFWIKKGDILDEKLSAQIYNQFRQGLSYQRIVGRKSFVVFWNAIVPLEYIKINVSLLTKDQIFDEISH